jgi:ASC-1-like (ASCH) protein
MNALEAKVLFELNKEGEVTVQIQGGRAGVKSGIMTIIEKMAQLDKVTVVQELEEMVKVAKFKEENPIEDILKERKAHGEMPEEIKQFFDKLFGGVK